MSNLVQCSEANDFNPNSIGHEDSLLNLIIDSISSKWQEIL